MKSRKLDLNNNKKIHLNHSTSIILFYRTVYGASELYNNDKKYFNAT